MLVDNETVLDNEFKMVGLETLVLYSLLMSLCLVKSSTFKHNLRLNSHILFR